MVRRSTATPAPLSWSMSMVQDAPPPLTVGGVGSLFALWCGCAVSGFRASG